MKGRRSLDLSAFLYLAELKLYRCRPSQNLDCYPEFVFLVINLLNHAIEIIERTISHAHHFTRLEQHLRPGLVYTFFNPMQD